MQFIICHNSSREGNGLYVLLHTHQPHLPPPPDIVENGIIHLEENPRFYFSVLVNRMCFMWCNISGLHIKLYLIDLLNA